MLLESLIDASRKGNQSGCTYSVDRSHYNPQRTGKGNKKGEEKEGEQRAHQKVVRSLGHADEVAGHMSYEAASHDDQASHAEGQQSGQSNLAFGGAGRLTEATQEIGHDHGRN